MIAKHVYPERFGEWLGNVDGEPHPEMPGDERPFERRRVADIVNGDG